MKNIIKKESEAVMKKISFVIIMLLLFLCGCSANGNNNDLSHYYGELSKAQKISIIPSTASQPIKTLNTNGEVKNFINSLDIKNWKFKKLPENLEKSGTFSFSQEETLKFGKTNKDGKFHDVCEIYSYKESPYVTLKIAGVEMDFEATYKAAEYLNGYFK